jgi:hypothetical protein
MSDHLLTNLKKSNTVKQIGVKFYICNVVARKMCIKCVYILIYFNMYFIYIYIYIYSLIKLRLRIKQLIFSSFQQLELFSLLAMCVL